MCPRVEELNNFQNERIQAAVERRDRKMEQVVLPSDFTGQIFLRCAEEASRIRSRIAFLQGELTHIVERIAALQQEARSMMPCIVHTKTTGDILSSFEVVNVTDSNQRIITEEVLKFRKTKIDPLRRQQNRLEEEIFVRNQEIGQLRRIGRGCGSGDVGLLNLLTDAWRGRLEIGAAVLGKLPPMVRMFGSGSAIFVTPGGDVLPSETLTPDGKPDLPATNSDGVGFGWHGDHPEALPGQPKTTDDFVRPK